MLQLKETADKIILCLARDDFEGAFEIANEGIRQACQSKTSLNEIDGFHCLVVNAAAAASLALEHGYKKHRIPYVPVERRRQWSPGLRVAVPDPHGLYRIWNYRVRYLRFAAYPSRKISPQIQRELKKVYDWYDNRPEPIRKKVESWLQRRALRSQEREARLLAVVHIMAHTQSNQLSDSGKIFATLTP